MVQVSRGITVRSLFSSAESSEIHLKTRTSIDLFHGSVSIDVFHITNISCQITHGYVCKNYCLLEKIKLFQ